MTPTPTPGLSPSSCCPRTLSSLPHSLNLQGFWQLFVDPQVRECRGGVPLRVQTCAHVCTCVREHQQWWDADGPR